MAIVKFAAPIADLRGLLAGVVFSANASSSYVKSWRMPRYQRTNYQNLYRARFSTFAIAWRALSTAQRAAWSAWAQAPAQARINSVGESYNMTGWQAFCSINSNRLIFGQATTATAPSTSAPAAPTLSSLTAYEKGGSGNTTLVVASGTFTSYPGKFFAAIVPSIGINDTAPFWPLVQTTAATSTTSFNLNFALTFRFGEYYVGQKLLIKVSRLNSQYVESSRSIITDDFEA